MSPDDDVLALKADLGGEPATERAFVLEVTRGKDSGRTMAVTPHAPGPFLVGTGPTAHFRLTDPRVARRHLALTHLGGRLKVVALGGTRVGSVAVEAAFVDGGEVLTLGDTRLVVGTAHVPPERLSTKTSFGTLLGASQEMKKLHPLLTRLAASDAPVLVEGEPGTGKGTLAFALHEQSPRRGRPFVRVDGEEARLFGGGPANRPTLSVFDVAAGGTVYIPELTALSLSAQAQLLPLLGPSAHAKGSARVVVATARDVEREAAEGRLNDSILEVLGGQRVELPPLRARHGDVRLLAQAFWHQLGGPGVGVPPALLDAWDDASWPGNLRELRATVAEVLAGQTNSPESFAAVLGVALQDVAEACAARRTPLNDARTQVVTAFERASVEHLLKSYGADLERAAWASGFTVRNLEGLLARLGYRRG